MFDTHKAINKEHNKKLEEWFGGPFNVFFLIDKKEINAYEGDESVLYFIGRQPEGHPELVDKIIAAYLFGNMFNDEINISIDDEYTIDNISRSDAENIIKNTMQVLDLRA